MNSTNNYFVFPACFNFSSFLTFKNSEGFKDAISAISKTFEELNNLNLH